MCSSGGASGSASSQPSFVEKNLTLYFEIDTDVWQSEEELDKTKVSVDRVTVFGAEVPDSLSEAEAYQDDAAAALDDCVAIEFLRSGDATLFSNVTYTVDSRNKLFAQVRDISYAGKIVRRVYESGSLLYTYCCTLEAPEVPRYFSISR